MYIKALIIGSYTADLISGLNVIRIFSIFAQVNITNPTRWLVKFDVLICFFHLYIFTYRFKMAASRFVEVSDKEIREIKMNSDQKNAKKRVQKY